MIGRWGDWRVIRWPSLRGSNQAVSSSYSRCTRMQSEYWSPTINEVSGGTIATRKTSTWFVGMVAKMAQWLRAAGLGNQGVKLPIYQSIARSNVTTLARSWATGIDGNRRPYLDFEVELNAVSWTFKLTNWINSALLFNHDKFALGQL